MLDLNTFKVKQHRIGDDSKCPPEIRKFHEGKLISILPQWRYTDGELRHMNLKEGTLDDISSKISQTTSKVGKYSYCFQEISKGIYSLETKYEGYLPGGKTYVEVISWRSEELSKTMSKFLHIRGFEEVDTDSMDRDEFIASKDNFKATG